MKKNIFIAALCFFTLILSAQTSNEILVLSAIVKDKTIANAQVIFQKNGETSVPVYTNQSGKVNIPSEYKDDPNLTIIIKKEGYSTLVSKCACGGLTYAISPVMQELDGLRIVLSWGNSPLDIDSHLSYPGGYICYYKKDASMTNLDVDDTDSYGPETITITKKIAGKKYVYAVHDFSDRDLADNSNLSNISSAKVFVYVGNTLIKTYKMPTGQKGNIWIPFTIDETGNLVDVGDFKNATTWEGVSAILRNYRFDSNQNSSVSAIDIEESVKINKKGEDEYHNGNLESAIIIYQDAIEMNPRDGQIYSNLGLAFQKLNREAEALWANRKAIEFASGEKTNIIKASSFYNIAKIYEKKQKWDQALENYKLAKQNNNNPTYDKGIARVSAKIR